MNGKGFFNGLFGNLTTVQHFLKVLTWKKIAQVTVFLFVISLAWATYETRQSIYNFVNQSKIESHTPESIKLSKKTIKEINSAVDKSDLIVGIQITIVDFQKNIRSTIYTYTDDNNILGIYQRYEDSGLSDLPIFSNDVIDNRRMVDLINGEFICTPFTSTIDNKLIPEASKYISTICANGIPPYYGKFMGMVSVFTKRPPTSEEVDQIRTLTKDLSMMVYDNDFK
jgi:hypothetical protein